LLSFKVTQAGFTSIRMKKKFPDFSLIIHDKFTKINWFTGICWNITLPTKSPYRTYYQVENKISWLFADFVVELRISLTFNDTKFPDFFLTLKIVFPDHGNPGLVLTPIVRGCHWITFEVDAELTKLGSYHSVFQIREGVKNSTKLATWPDKINGQLGKIWRDSHVLTPQNSLLTLCLYT